MLKRKIEINYRKAVATRDGRHNRCKNCGRRMLMDIGCCSAGSVINPVLRQDWRCEVIGLHNSRKYACEADHVCDVFKAIVHKA